MFTMFGVGFYLLHGCIQVHVTDLSQTARGAATSMHSTFFFIGQAIGPVVYRMDLPKADWKRPCSSARR